MLNFLCCSPVVSVNNIFFMDPWWQSLALDAAQAFIWSPRIRQVITCNIESSCWLNQVRNQFSCTHINLVIMLWKWPWPLANMQTTVKILINTHLRNGERPQTVYSVKRRYVQGPLGFGKEITQVESIEVDFTHLILSSVNVPYGFKSLSWRFKFSLGDASLLTYGI